MVRDLQGLLEAEPVGGLEVENTPAAGVFRRGSPLEDEVVVGLGASGVGGDPRHGPANVGELAQSAELLWARVEVTQQDDVVLIGSSLFEGDERIGEGIDFLRYFIWIGMRIDHPECEALIGLLGAGPESDKQWRPMEPVPRIVHGADRRGINLNAAGIVKKGVLLFAVGPAQPRTDHVLIAATVSVDLLDEAGDDLI